MVHSLAWSSSVFAALVLLAIAPTSRPAAKVTTQPASSPAEDMVWIVDGGTTYHRQKCKLIKGMNAQAVALGSVSTARTPCRSCMDDAADAPEEVQYTNAPLTPMDKAQLHKEISAQTTALRADNADQNRWKREQVKSMDRRDPRLKSAREQRDATELATEVQVLVKTISLQVRMFQFADANLAMRKLRSLVGPRPTTKNNIALHLAQLDFMRHYMGFKQGVPKDAIQPVKFMEGRPHVGSFGFLPQAFDVISVLDAHTAIVLYPAGDIDGVRIELHGGSTEGWTDDQPMWSSEEWRITGTTKYKTVRGSMDSILLAEAVDGEGNVQQKADAQPAKQSAQKTPAK